MTPSQQYRITTQEDWPERIKEIMRNPLLVDKLGSADLKRACKMMAGTLLRVGERAAHAEIQLDRVKLSGELQLSQDLNRVTAHNLVLTGGRPPSWSYLYKEAVENLHLYLEFEVKRMSKGYTVLGVSEEGKRIPLYDFDFAGLGVSQANSAAHLMAAHLRQSFVPRENQEAGL